jgi:hypothetical protein
MRERWSSLDRLGDTMANVMRGCRVRVRALLLAGAWASSAVAAAPTLEPEFVVSPTGRFPVVAISASGDSAVGWVVRAAYARVYSARGDSRGPAFLLSEDANQFAAWLRIASNDRGQFVAVWAANVAEGQGSAKLRVLARRFDRFGKLQGPPFAVSSTTELPPGAQEQMPAVGMDDRGGFVVVWSPDPASVVARRFDRNGVPLGSNFQVHAEGDARLARVAMQRDGSFLVCWSTNLGGQLVAGARARAFHRNGEPLSGDIVLNSAEGQQGCTDASRNGGGGYTVLWTGRMGAERGSFAREVDGSGNLVGDPVRIIPFEPAGELPPVFSSGGSIAALPRGRFLLAWAGLDPLQLEDSDWAIRARQFSSDLWPISPPIQVNNSVLFGLSQPVAACAPSGACIVVWQREWDPNQDDLPEIRARKLNSGRR